MMFAIYGLIFAIALWAAYSIYYRREWSCISLADIPGPNPESYLLGILFNVSFCSLLLYFAGNTPDLYSSECGVIEAKWLDAFGALFLVKGSFGVHILSIIIRVSSTLTFYLIKEDRLYIADPAALQHLLQKGGYNYTKIPGDNATKALSGGRGLFWAESMSFLDFCLKP
jgi:hypothetical protein